MARVKITPPTPFWMSGYAARTHPSEGVEQDLWAKALALRDPGGHQVVLVTTDLIGLPRAISDEVAARVAGAVPGRALTARPERLAHALRAGGAEEPRRPLRLQRRRPAPRRRLRRGARRPPGRGRGQSARGPRARAPLGGARRRRLRRQPPRAHARGREDRREPQRPRRPRRPGAEGHGRRTARSAPCSSATPATTRRWAATSTGSAATTPGTRRPSWRRPTPGRPPSS